jgi:uncharacterized RDD family membrane protein YckC
MTWYYSVGGQQLGPLDEAAFRELVTKGEIQPATLVWNSGMSSWKPWSEVGAPAAAGSFCSECGTRLPSDEMIQFGAALVCANCKDRFTQKIREGVTPGENRRYGGFWIRVLAKLIDGIVVGTCIYGVTFVFAGWTGIISGATGVASIIFLMQWLAAASYEIYLTSRYGGTLGKIALSLRVISARGGDLSLGLSAGRYLAQLASSFTLLIGYIMAAFDPQKRALHDRICSTLVVKI